MQEIDVSAGDMVRLTADTVFSLANEAPDLFRALYERRATAGKVVGFEGLSQAEDPHDETQGVPRIVIDFGPEINQLAGNNEGIRFVFQQGYMHRTAYLVQRANDPRPLDEMPPEVHFETIEMQDVEDDTPIAPPSFPGFVQPANAATMQTTLPATDHPLSFLKNLAQQRAAHGVVPLRVSVAMSVMRDFIGLKQYAIVQDVYRGKSPDAADVEADVESGEEWKQGTEYDGDDKTPQLHRVRLEFDGQEKELYNASLRKIQRWIEQDDEPAAMTAVAEDGQDAGVQCQSPDLGDAGARQGED